MIALLFCLVSYWAQQASGGMKLRHSVPLRIEDAILAYGLCLYKFMWPFSLAVFYLHPGSQINHLAVMSSGLMLITLTGFAWLQRSRCPAITVGWFWYLGTLLPVIGLIQIGDQQLADRYAYFPIIGIDIALIWGLHHYLL